MEIHWTMNQQATTWVGNPGEIALDVLRREGYLSVKSGCREGDCGACTILVDGASMRACLLLMGQLEGRQVTTVEGLGSVLQPHPLQKAFVEAGAVQCGYCTPGMLLSAKALLDLHPNPDQAQVREALDGNLCRCTGYKKIIEAVLTAAQRMQP
jgi:aerobic-type carbon monoxide dehydrogenase small subunit (CoxS/CutS family)